MKRLNWSKWIECIKCGSSMSPSPGLDKLAKWEPGPLLYFICESCFESIYEPRMDRWYFLENKRWVRITHINLTRHFSSGPLSRRGRDNDREQGELPWG